MCARVGEAARGLAGERFNGEVARLATYASS